MAKLQINTGLISLDIERDGEPVGQIRFNPESSRFRHAITTFMLECGTMEKLLMDKANALEKDTETVELSEGVLVRDNAQQVLDLWDERDAWVCERFNALFGPGHLKWCSGSTSRTVGWRSL